MTLRTKAWLALAGLLLVAAWPMVHRGLVIHHGLNPWKLYGWAMYCVPQYESELRFLANPKGKEDRSPRPTRYPIKFEGASEILRSYQVMEAGLGGLASTDALAAILFEAGPAMGRVIIHRSIGRFDAETAMPVIDYDTRVYNRP